MSARPPRSINWDRIATETPEEIDDTPDVPESTRPRVGKTVFFDHYDDKFPLNYDSDVVKEAMENTYDYYYDDEEDDYVTTEESKSQSTYIVVQIAAPIFVLAFVAAVCVQRVAWKRSIKEIKTAGNFVNPTVSVIGVKDEKDVDEK